MCASASKAVEILEAYEGTLEEDYPPENERCEHGEMLLYKVSVVSFFMHNYYLDIKCLMYFFTIISILYTWEFQFATFFIYLLDIKLLNETANIYLKTVWENLVTLKPLLKDCLDTLTFSLSNSVIWIYEFLPCCLTGLSDWQYNELASWLGQPLVQNLAYLKLNPTYMVVTVWYKSWYWWLMPSIVNSKVVSSVVFIIPGSFCQLDNHRTV